MEWSGMTPSEALAALVDEIGKLSAEQAVLAATAGRLASAMADEDVPPYALAGLSRELRAAVATLLGAPPVSAGMRHASWERILSPPDAPWDGD
jgi:hypothetical protein